MIRVVLATGGANREPVDEVAAIGHSHDEIYFFTESLHLAGRIATHRMTMHGSIVSEAPLEVGAPC